MVIFHLFHIIIMIPREKCSMRLNHCCFWLKLVMILGISIGLLFVPNSALKYYVYFCMAASFIFLIYQTVNLIDLSYLFSNSMVKRYHQGDNLYAIVLIFFAILFLGLNVLLFYFNFKWFWLSGLLLIFS